MFKRVQKRRKRQEDEEALGLDEDMKEVLGLNDTDSDESDSSEDEGSSDAESAVGHDVLEKLDGIKADEQDEDDGEGEGEGSDADDGTSVDDDPDEPPMSISQALKNPIYTISLDPDVQACISCPGKLLKNLTMIEVHLSSGTHARRYKRFSHLARVAGPTGDVRAVAKASAAPSEAAQTRSSQSKRAQKRQEKRQAIQLKREKTKKLKAKALTKKRDAKAKITQPAAGSPVPDKIAVKTTADSALPSTRKKAPKSNANWTWTQPPRSGTDSAKAKKALPSASSEYKATLANLPKEHTGRKRREPGSAKTGEKRKRSRQ